MSKHPLNVALELCQSGEADQAEAILRTMEQDPRAQYNLGWHDLRHGDFRKGMEGLDKGRWIGVHGSPSIPGKLWRDEPLNGKTLLLRSEGGLGDQICNFRFAEMFQNRGARVVVSCAPSLAQIFSQHGVFTVAEEATPFIHYDYWVPAMSAAYMLGFDYGTLPGKPYLRAQQRPRDDRLRIGLRWGGNVNQKDIEPTRKLPVDQLLAATAHINADLFSFQRDADLVDFPGTDLQDDLKSWEETAEWLSSMDLLVTSCTSVAHLAGALGVETWILAPIMPYYTWAMPGERTAWYESVRLFRQTACGNWGSALHDVKLALINRFGGERYGLR